MKPNDQGEGYPVELDVLILKLNAAVRNSTKGGNVIELQQKVNEAQEELISWHQAAVREEVLKVLEEVELNVNRIIAMDTRISEPTKISAVMKELAFDPLRAKHNQR